MTDDRRSLSDDVNSQPNNVSRRRGIIAEYKVLDQLRKKKEEQCTEITGTLRSLRVRLRQVAREISLTAGSDDDDDDVSGLDLAQLESDMQYENDETNSTPAAAASMLELSEAATAKDIVEMILEASVEAEGLENRRDMLNVMLDEKIQQVEDLTRQLQESKDKENEAKRNLEVAEIENSRLRLTDVFRQNTLLNRQRSSAVEGNDHLTEIVDPGLVSEKIADLKDRISCLMAIKTPADLFEMCESLQKQLEEHNRKWDQYHKAEKERADRAAAERDAAMADRTKLVRQVEELEEKVSILERQLETSDDAKLAMKFQLDEYKREIELVQQERDREKAQRQSIETQWETLYQEIRTLREQEQETAKLEELLQKANEEKELIQSHLHATAAQSTAATSTAGIGSSGGARAGVRGNGSRRRLPQNAPKQTGSTPRVIILEEDSEKKSS